MRICCNYVDWVNGWRVMAVESYGVIKPKWLESESCVSPWLMCSNSFYSLKTSFPLGLFQNSKMSQSRKEIWWNRIKGVFGTAYKPSVFNFCTYLCRAVRRSVVKFKPLLTIFFSPKPEGRKQPVNPHNIFTTPKFVFIDPNVFFSPQIDKLLSNYYSGFEGKKHHFPHWTHFTAQKLSIFYKKSFKTQTHDQLSKKIYIFQVFRDNVLYNSSL